MIGPEEDEDVVVVVVVLMVEVVLVVVMDWDDFMEGLGVDEESVGVVAVCAVDAEVEGLGEMTPLPGDDDDDDAVGLL